MALELKSGKINILIRTQQKLEQPKLRRKFLKTCYKRWSESGSLQNKKQTTSNKPSGMAVRTPRNMVWSATSSSPDTKFYGLQKSKNQLGDGSPARTKKNNKRRQRRRTDDNRRSDNEGRSNVQHKIYVMFH